MYHVFTEAGKETKVCLKLFSGTNLLSAPLRSLEFRELKLFIWGFIEAWNVANSQTLNKYGFFGKPDLMIEYWMIYNFFNKALFSLFFILYHWQ